MGCRGHFVLTQRHPEKWAKAMHRFFNAWHQQLTMATAPYPRLLKHRALRRMIGGGAPGAKSCVAQVSLVLFQKSL